MLSPWIIFLGYICILVFVLALISFLVFVAESASSYHNAERSRLYGDMATELVKQGPVFLGDGETSQSLKVGSFE